MIYENMVNLDISKGSRHSCFPSFFGVFNIISTLVKNRKQQPFKIYQMLAITKNNFFSHTIHFPKFLGKDKGVLLLFKYI